MPRPPSFLFPVLSLALTLACRPSTPDAGAPSSTRLELGLRGGEPARAIHMPPPEVDTPEQQPTSTEIPVDPDDGVWGQANAPVTIVVFMDLECPFCADGHEVVSELSRRYGPGRLRVVMKHIPLAMHREAVPAARIAQAVLDLGGRKRFFEFIDLAYSRPMAIASGRALELAGALGLDPELVRERAASTEIGRQVLEDAVLADRLAIPATPHYRINGLPLTGALPFDTLSRAIETELEEVGRLRQNGVAPDEIYARRVTVNILRPER